MSASEHHADVFSHLRAALVLELDSAEMATLLGALVGQGWRPWQLRQRVGALPVQASLAQDVEVIRALLSRLLTERSPQASYAEELERRTRERFAARSAPAPAADADRERWIAVIRTGLKGRPRVVAPAPVRTRPDCALCQGESDFFVRRDVHLCAHCVDLLATGAISAERDTGS